MDKKLKQLSVAMSKRADSILSRGTNQTGSFDGSTGQETLDRQGLEKRKNMAYSTRRHDNIFDSFRLMEAPIKFVEKTEESSSFIETSMRKSELFKKIKPEEMQMIIKVMKVQDIKAGETIINRDDTGDKVYLVKEGKFNVLDREGITEKVLHTGTVFGELALVYNCLRTRTVVAQDDSVVYYLEKSIFVHIMATLYKELETEIGASLRQIPLLQHMDDDFFDALVDHVVKMKFHKGEPIIKKGEVGKELFFVQSGSVQVSEGEGEKSNQILQAGSYFGERALLKNERRSANVTANEETVCLSLDRETFERSFGPLKDVLARSMAVNTLKDLEILRSLDDAMRERVVNTCRQEEYEDGTYILHQGDAGNKFFVLYDGGVEIVQIVDGVETKLRDLGAGDYFGEGSLLKHEAISADVIASGTTKCFTLQREEFEELLGGSLEMFNERIDNYLGSKQKADDIMFDDLKQLKTLGTGTFGRVKLVEHKKTHETYALKILTKGKIIKYDQKENVMNEKNILRLVQHPFIPQLYATYNRDNCLFMLLELVQGGELFSLLRKLRKKLNSKFYAACMLDAFDYLHGLKIVYRDLKPENVLIYKDGYVKLVDFGFAKKVKSRTYTLCGTPEYMAPEVILRKGYDKGVDHWSLGIVLYEMNFGWTPFADFYGNDHMVICKNILRSKLRFPKHRGMSGKKKSMELRDLLKALLDRDPKQRLGNLRGGAQDVKDHDWWGGYDFKGLRNKSFAAPWIPKIESSTDDSNFDDYDENFVVEGYEDDGSGWDEFF